MTTALPKTMRAIKSQSAGLAHLHPSVPLPSLSPPRSDYLLVRVRAVALNPTDHKHIDNLPAPSSTVGCDYAGTVVALGAHASPLFRPGDRIAGFVHGVNALHADDGAFADYALAQSAVQMHIPASMPDEAAATLGVGVATVGQALYQSLKLPWPETQNTQDTQSATQNTQKTPLFIYGGSTATGLFALQFAKLSGLYVVTTCSPRNFELVKQMGADEAFDYNDAECGAKVRAATGDALMHAFDCVSEGESAAICCAALAGKGGGVYSALLPVKELPRADVQNNGQTLAYTTFGKDMKYRSREVPAKPEDHEFAARWWREAERLFAEGKVRPIPYVVDEGGKGLEGVFQGLEALRKGKVSGKKLVYKIAED